MAGKQQKDSLSRKQQAALLALMQQPSITRAAAQAGIGERSLQRWLSEDEAFKSEYLKLRREIVSNAILQLQKSTTAAVVCLLQIMRDEDAPASARVAAAREVLTQSLRAVELEDLGQKITELEAQIEELGISNSNGRTRHRGVLR
jgi:hypothetical protein